MQGLKIVKGGLLRGPANDKTLGVVGRRLGDDVEVDVVDLLMSDTSIVLDAHSMSIQWTPRVSRRLTCKRL